MDSTCCFYCKIPLFQEDFTVPEGWLGCVCCALWGLKAAWASPHVWPLQARPLFGAYSGAGAPALPEETAVN
jgi:hypothetical protein